MKGLSALVLTLVLAASITAVAWMALAGGRTNAQDASPQPTSQPGVRSGYNSLEVHLSVAREVPGFGGYFNDPATGKLSVYLKDPANERDAVVSSLRRWLGVEESQVQILQGQYNFGDLENWKGRATTASVFSVPEVVYTDAQERRNRVEIGVTTYDAVPAVKEQLAKTGVPLEAVIFELTEPGSDDLDDLHSPRTAGLQIKNGVSGNSTCTLGFAAMRGNDLGFVTASHCTPNRGQVDWMPFFQPWTYDYIGVETVDPPMITGGICPAYFFCRFSDAVWAEYSPDVAVSYGYIARPPLGSNNWNGVDRFRILGYVSPNVCDTVRMVGKATGYTTGKVTNTWINQVHSQENYLYIYLYQHRASYQRTGGDSGAPVFSYGSGTDVYLHGSHWTGNSDSGVKCGISVSSYGVFSDTSWLINELGLTTDLSYQGGP